MMDNKDKKKMQAEIIQLVSLRMVKETSILYSHRIIRKPEDAADLIRQFIGDFDRESFCIMCLNTKNEITAIQQVSLGTINSSLVHTAESYKLAILSNSTGVIFAHNHPSGDPTPSSQDIEVNLRLQAAGELLGIPVIDHIILGDSNFISLKETGFM